MKKLISIVLILSALLSLFSCTASEGGEKDLLSIEETELPKYKKGGINASPTVTY